MISHTEQMTSAAGHEGQLACTLGMDASGLSAFFSNLEGFRGGRAHPICQEWKSERSSEVSTCHAKGFGAGLGLLALPLRE